MAKEAPHRQNKLYIYIRAARIIGYPDEQDESNVAMAELGWKILKKVECNLKLLMVWLLQRLHKSYLSHLLGQVISIGFLVCC